MSLHYLVKCRPVSSHQNYVVLLKNRLFQEKPTWLCCIAAVEFQASDIMGTVKSHLLC